MPDSVTAAPISQALGAASVPYTETIGKDALLTGVWLGQAGARQMEICELRSADEPNIQTLRSAWQKRQQRRAVPLVVFWQGQSHVLITEPGGDPVAVVQIEPAAALALLRRALATPAREAVQAVLALLERSQGSGGVAGFRNRNLLSTHYVLNTYRRDHQQSWIDLDSAARELRAQSGARLLRALGYNPTANASTFEVLDKNSPCVHAIVLQEGASFDRSPAGPGDAPATRLLVEAREEGAQRAVIVSGRLLRLYLANVAQGLDDIATAGTYIELDLEILAPEWSALLPLLFSATSHLPNGLFATIVFESARYAIGLRDRFRKRIYEHVVGGIVSALYDARGRERADVDLLFHATMRLLFRLLFVLYAEDRNLLPLGNPEYRRVSLTQTLFRLEALQRTGKTFDARQATVWDDIFRIFDAIRGGSDEWNIPEYNGGLFEPDVPGFPEASLLESVQIPNAIFAPLLLDIAFDAPDQGQRGKIDFGDLGVRHIGTLYEGLLTYSVHIAHQDLAVDASGDLVPAVAGGAIEVPSGHPYIASPKGNRKSSGSYYTPSFVVRRLIDKALRPALERHLAHVETLIPERQWEAMLQFRIVDPAMGSGHFLVDALDTIADRFATFLRNNPRIVNPSIAASRERITAIGKEVGVVGLGDAVSDFDLLRRIILKRCVYGVDVQPMAVELAKLSLWLHSFVPGLPLSYLGHTLRSGNAIVGVAGPEITRLLEGSLFAEQHHQALATALESAKTIAEGQDLAISEINESSEAQRAMEHQLRGLRKALDAYVCRRYAVSEIGSDATGRRQTTSTRQLLENGDLIATIIRGEIPAQHIDDINKACAEAARLNVFHWQLAFPEVFLKDSPGFDVVLGNPPWEELNVDSLGFFAPYIPGLKHLGSVGEQQALVDTFCAIRPDVQALFQDSKRRMESLRAVIGDMFSWASGKLDLYRLFAARVSQIIDARGALGMVFPRSMMIGDSAAPIRATLFEGSETSVHFGRNEGFWLFPSIEHSYMIAAVVVDRNTSNLVHISGPAQSLTQWETLDASQSTWTVAELKAASDGMEIPLIPDPKSADLFRRLVANGQRFDEPIDATTFRPWIEFNATTDRHNGLLQEGSHGWPVYAGECFDIWTPQTDKTAPFVLDESIGLAALRRKQARSPVWSSVSPTLRLTLPLPPQQYHVLFRDVTNCGNYRTVIAAIVPSGRFATHTAPALLCFNGTYRDVLLRLGIMCSLPFDWAARRRVERHLSFFILNALPVPKVGKADRRAARIIELTTSLVCVDPAFAGLAKELRTKVRAIAPQDRDAATAEIDALVASMYELSVEDLDVIFSDFDFEPVPQSRRNAIRQYFLATEAPTVQSV